MSKPRYCTNCGEAVTSESGYEVESGLFTHYLAILYYCENLDCPRYGLLARLAETTKPEKSDPSKSNDRRKDEQITN